MKTGSELIADERQRQINIEGWTPSHDDNHDNGEMSLAAACYCLVELIRNNPERRKELPIVRYWPWSMEWWKPEGGYVSKETFEVVKTSEEGRIRELQKAGALIAAEIDRLQRLK